MQNILEHKKQMFNKSVREIHEMQPELKVLGGFGMNGVSSLADTTLALEGMVGMSLVMFGLILILYGVYNFGVMIFRTDTHPDDYMGAMMKSMMGIVIGKSFCCSFFRLPMVVRCGAVKLVSRQQSVVDGIDGFDHVRSRNFAF